MKLNKAHITQIKTDFEALKSKEDLVALLNKVNLILYGPNYNKLTLKQLTYYSNPNFSKDRYTSFAVSKKNGGYRTIHAPINSLRIILRSLNIILNTIAEPHFKATGFVPGKSIVDNAKPHVGNHYVYNIDLKDFFHSFNRTWVKYGFMIAPFNLGREREELAFLLASLCTHPFQVGGVWKTVLPQGAPTSPTITNILCVKLDKRLNGLSKRFKINYSRYADDISFSSQSNIFIKNEFLDELHRIIEVDQMFEINSKKTRNQKNSYRQEVTGLTVNTKINVNVRYIKQLRMWLYYWEKYGYSQASSLFIKDYQMDKGHIKNRRSNFANVLRGKLDYLKMVKGDKDPTYRKLKYRFDNLNPKTSNGRIKNEKEVVGLSTIVELIFNKGVDKAMEEYTHH